MKNMYINRFCLLESWDKECSIIGVFFSGILECGSVDISFGNDFVLSIEWFFEFKRLLVSWKTENSISGKRKNAISNNNITGCCTKWVWAEKSQDIILVNRFRETKHTDLVVLQLRYILIRDKFIDKQGEMRIRWGDLLVDILAVNTDVCCIMKLIDKMDISCWLIEFPLILKILRKQLEFSSRNSIFIPMDFIGEFLIQNFLTVFSIDILNFVL